MHRLSRFGPLMLGALVACAASPVTDLAEQTATVEPAQPVDGKDGEGAPSEADEGANEESVDQGPAPTEKRDASLSVDSGRLSPRDASTPEAPAATGAKDAGRDAAPSAPTATPSAPALPRPVPCKAPADCAAVSCFPVGLLACCRIDSVCGCSWNPLAYCL